jgi:hypothetical protein
MKFLASRGKYFAETLRGLGVETDNYSSVTNFQLPFMGLSILPGFCPANHPKAFEISEDSAIFQRASAITSREVDR